MLTRVSDFMAEPLAGSMISDRVVMRFIGMVFFGAAPGSTQPQGISGIRYAVFTQNPSNGFASTVISLKDFTQ